MKLTIVLAPYDSGHYQAGFGLGPEALINGGLVDALSLNGHDVAVEDIGEVGDDQGREIATGFAVCRAVAGKVAAARAEKRFPIVLSGNCLTTVGAVAGDGADSVVWMDQHGDINTPETSIFGFLDGMALATVLGLCWVPMARQVPGFKAVDPARCVLVNARDLDPQELSLLETLPVIRSECSGAVAAAGRLRAAGAVRTHLHLDLDVLDPGELQVNRYAKPGGPDPELLIGTVTGIARAAAIAGITVSAYDPAFDPQADVPPVVGRLLNELLDAVGGL